MLQVEREMILSASIFNNTYHPFTMTLHTLSYIWSHNNNYHVVNTHLWCFTSSVQVLLTIKLFC